MTRRVLVTRPEPGASATAARLSNMGLSPLVLPLTRIEALAPQPPDGKTFDALVLTSANAVRKAPGDLLSRVSGLPCFAVGPATADAAQKAGLGVMLASGGDATSLASDIISRIGPGARLLYLCGRTRTPDLEAALEIAEIHVEPVETYDAVALDISSRALRGQLAEGPLDFALVHSARGGALLAGIMARPELVEIFAGTTIFSISAKAAAPLADHRVEVAEEPSEQALLALVKAKV